MVGTGGGTAREARGEGRGCMHAMGFSAVKPPLQRDDGQVSACWTGPRAGQTRLVRGPPPPARVVQKSA
jgi:hypothetical protein